MGDTDKDGSLDTKEKLKETKPSISSLPMYDASEAWMNDDVGILEPDSDEEMEPKSKDNKIKDRDLEIKEKNEDIKPVLKGLPMNEASDAWMDDDVGTIESDSDNESVDSKEKTSSQKIKVEKNQPTLKEKTTEVKSQIAGLPMDDASDAWMNDDVGSIDSDSDTDKDGSLDTKEKIKETKPSISGLLMDDASEAWMNDDVGIMDSDSDEEIEPKSKDKKVEDRDLEIKEKKEEIKPALTGLPMNEASDAWMDDDVGTIDSDSDNESVDSKEKTSSDKNEVEKNQPNLKEKTTEVKSQ